MGTKAHRIQWWNQHLRILGIGAPKLKAKKGKNIHTKWQPLACRGKLSNNWTTLIQYASIQYLNTNFFQPNSQFSCALFLPTTRRKCQHTYHMNIRKPNNFRITFKKCQFTQPFAMN